MTRTPAEALTPIIATRDEIIALGEAILRYTSWLARTPAGAVEHRNTIALLCHLQGRFVQLLTNREGE